MEQKYKFMLTEPTQALIKKGAEPLEVLLCIITKELMQYLSNCDSSSLPCFQECRETILQQLSQYVAAGSSLFTISKAIDTMPFAHFISISKQHYLQTHINLLDFGVVLDKSTLAKFRESSIYKKLQSNINLWLFTIDKLSDMLQRAVSYHLLTNEQLQAISPDGLSKHWKLSIKSTYSYAIRNSVLYIGSQIAKKMSGRVSKLVLHLEKYTLPYLFSNVLLYLIGQQTLLCGVLFPATTSLAIAAASYLSGTIMSTIGDSMESKYALSDLEIYSDTIIKAKKKIRSDVKIIKASIEKCLISNNTGNVNDLIENIKSSYQIDLTSKYTWKNTKEENYLDEYYKTYITENGWVNITKMDESEIDTIEELKDATSSSIRAQVLSEYTQIVDYFKL